MVSLNPILPLVFLLLTTFYHLGEGREVHTFVVGESDNGRDSDKNLTHWAESHRFIVGDSLEFDYDIKKDSVLQVTKENYEKCNTENPMNAYPKVKPTIVKLDVYRPYYFIIGAQGNCVKGQKLIVVPQSPEHRPTTPKPVPATAPPTPSKLPTSPAPAPANNTAAGLVAGSGIFWSFVVVIGLAWT